MNDKKVAIIIVNFNGTTDTIECIASLKNNISNSQTIFVVDNNSDDQEVLLKKCNNQRNVVVIPLKENIGFSGANNVGIQKALEGCYEYVLLLNNDTVVKKGFLGELLKSCDSKDVGIATGRILYHSEPNKVWFAGGEMNLFTAHISHLHNDLDKEKYITFCTGCLMLIDINIIKKIGMLSEEYFMYSEDADFSCRVINAGYKIVYNPKAVIFHKVSASTGGADSTFSQYYRTRNDYYILKKYSKNVGASLFFYYLRLTKRIINRSFSFKYTMLGLRDAKKNVKGKVNYKFTK